MTVVWPEFRLKHLARLVIDRASSPEGDGPYVGLEAISSWTGVIDSAAGAEPSGSLGTRFRPGDVLFGKLRPYLAKVAAPDFAGHCSGEALVLRPLAGTSPRFLRYRMAEAGMIDAIDASTYGAKMPRASWDFIGNLKFPVPPPDTQDMIADFLDQETGLIDHLIEMKKRLVVTFLEKNYACAKNMFASLSAKKWRVRHLGQFRNGSGFPVDLQGDPSQEIAFFKVKHLRTHGLDAVIIETDDTVSEETAASLRATIFPEGTIVFAKIGAALLLGRFSMLGRTACIDNNMAAFIPNEKLVDPNYALLGLSQSDMATMAHPGAVPSLNTEAFSNFTIPLPSKCVQQQFVEELREKQSAVREIISKTEHSIDCLREYRSALVTAAVTGQIDLTYQAGTAAMERQVEAIQMELPA